MSIIIKETKIQNISKNKYEELKISFIIKKEDYDNEMEQKLYQLNRDGICGVLAFQDIGIPEIDDRNKLLSSLHYYMELYCEKVGGSIEIEKITLYKKYKVKSRSQMETKDIKYEIDTFKTGLTYE